MTIEQLKQTAMNKTSLIQQARTKMQERVIVYLKKAFKGFACPVYLFGSYATGRHHGDSDVNILIVSPNALSSRYYREACDKMSGIDRDYDILMSPSINGLDSSIVDALQPLNSPDGQYAVSKQQTGLTLIELMVAMLIGLFLIGGVVQIFISTKQTYRLQENLSRVQENGRFAMDFIGKDLRMADFRACPAENPSVPNAVTGTNDAGANTTDTITITWSMTACSTILMPVPVPVTQTVIYAIQNATNGQPNAFSLFRSTNGNPPQELIEGIENMQILYGVDTPLPTYDGSANYYVPIDNVNVLGTDRIVSVRISLLAATPDDNVASQPLTYLYNGVPITPVDRRVRRVFTSTISLRNRLP